MKSVNQIDTPPPITPDNFRFVPYHRKQGTVRDGPFPVPLEPPVPRSIKAMAAQDPHVNAHYTNPDLVPLKLAGPTNITTRTPWELGLPAVNWAKSLVHYPDDVIKPRYVDQDSSIWQFDQIRGKFELVGALNEDQHESSKVRINPMQIDPNPVLPVRAPRRRRDQKSYVRIVLDNDTPTPRRFAEPEIVSLMETVPQVATALQIEYI